MGTLWQDLRYAARTLAKRPGFTAVVVLTLALGIGANAAIFSAVNAVIFKPLPFRDPAALVHVWEGRNGERYKRGEDSRFISVRPGTFHDWREQSRSFESMSAYSWRTMMLTGGDRAEALWAHHVADRFFETLGVQAQLGRVFNGDDYGPDAPRVVILSDGREAVSRKTGLYIHGSASDQRVSPAYFRTLGLKLVRGRLLDERDTGEAPMVAVVNETFARKFFSDEDPVGKRVTVDYTSWFPRITIVGVVADVKLNALDRQPFAEMFWLVAQAPSRDVWLTVRTNVEPLALASAVQREIREIDSDLPILEMSSMEGVIADSLWRPRFSAVLIGLFSGLALLLAVAGIYGVMSYQVGLRTREMGLRMALGADRRRIFSLIIGRGIKLALAGATIGAAVSLALGRLVASQLYGVSAYDPPTLVGVSLFLIAVAALACYLPARRATKVDPMVALRAE